MNKHEIAQILREIGLYIELLDENPLKGLSYRRAAESLENVDSLDAIIESQTLESLQGIGRKIAQLIYYFNNHGKLPYYENLKKKVPSSIFELLNIPGISVQKVRLLYRNLGIKNLNDLHQLLKKKSILTGFSPSFLKKLKERINHIRKHGYALLWMQAMSLAKILSESLGKKGQVEIAGELRRKNELIYSIDILCEFQEHDSYLLNPLILKTLSLKKGTVSVLLKKGIPATFHFSYPVIFSFDLLRATGSQEHLRKLKQEAAKQGIAFTALKKSNSEREIYNRLKLAYIPPELREDGVEIIAAKRDKLPQLVQQQDLKGALHCHTIASDGIDTIPTMVRRAKQLGWSYIGISDHSKSLKIARGMNEARLLGQIEEIRKINKKTSSFYVFSGIECDILKDGQLDFDKGILKKLDFVIVSIHSFFHLNKKEMTKRFIKAIENPYTTIIGHISGRLLQYRKGYELDLPKVIDACAANGKVIELNAYPNRMDMDWRHWRKAKEKGVKCCVNPDAHSAKQLSFCYYGIDAARKGWLERDDIINTYSRKDLKAFLQS
jgi:DNA polymerase (family X)